MIGTKNVLDAARAVVPDATVVLVSSADVYGIVREEELPIHETFRVAPANPYASSKVEAEHVAHDSFRMWGQRVVIAAALQPRGPGSVRPVRRACAGRPSTRGARDRGRRDRRWRPLDPARLQRRARRRARLPAARPVRSSPARCTTWPPVTTSGSMTSRRQLVESIAPGVRLVPDRVAPAPGRGAGDARELRQDPRGLRLGADHPTGDVAARRHRGPASAPRRALGNTARSGDLDRRTRPGRLRAPTSLEGLMESRAPAVVAVVVTTGPGPGLEATLASLAAQDYPELSLLVVANGEAEHVSRAGRRGRPARLRAGARGEPGLRRRVQRGRPDGRGLGLLPLLPRRRAPRLRRACT